MKNLLNPKWLLLINTLPIAFLFVFFYSQFSVIKSLLNEESINLWKNLSILLLSITSLNLIYTLVLIFLKRSISYIYGFLALIVYSAFIYIVFYNANTFIPFSIPQWMIGDNIILYVGSFLMPTIIFSIFILVITSIRTPENNNAWLNILYAIIIPLAWYLLFQIIIPLWHFRFINEHLTIILFITSTIIFIFFLIRVIYITGLKKSESFKKHQLYWKIPLTIILPIIGLLVNNGNPFIDSNYSGIKLLGDMSNNWFYILALLNGIILCLPNTENRNYRMVLFIARSITFSYTLYFFIVLLPLLPLSIIAIIIWGLGILMLIPLVLFIIHINEIIKDYSYLKAKYNINILRLISVISFLIIPLFITLSYVKDRSILNDALDYVYKPNYSKHYYIDKASLQNTLKTIKSHKKRNSYGVYGNKTPYLSSLFNWIVLDNLTLSNSKIRTIEQIFYGTEDKSRFYTDDDNNSNIGISNISHTSTYDQEQKVWRSILDVKIKNSGRVNNEYSTTFSLPIGCWISDYYLYVGNRKEKGILAEKKTAIWIYTQIKNKKKDPGILFYKGGNKVAFHVFPFAQNEVRKTGIEFIHKEPITLNFDNHELQFGNNDYGEIQTKNTEEVQYVSANEKSNLDKIQRQAYYHFLINTSKDKDSLIDENIQKINKLISKNLINAKNTRISFVNSYTTTTNMDKDWVEKYKNTSFEGGFFLEQAIKTNLVKAYENPSRTYPIFIVVENSIYDAILNNNFSDLNFTFPESDYFYCLNNKGNLLRHSLISNPKVTLTDSMDISFNNSVLAFPNKHKPTAFLKDNNQASIILKNDIISISESQIQQKNWETALLLQASWRSQNLHPETSDKEWLNLVKYSFESRIMTPVSSYIVVENEAQKAALLGKQKDVLEGNKAFDIDNASQMSEPSIYIIGLLLIALLWYRERKKSHKLSINNQ